MSNSLLPILPILYSISAHNFNGVFLFVCFQMNVTPGAFRYGDILASESRQPHGSQSLPVSDAGVKLWVFVTGRLFRQIIRPLSSGRVTLRGLILYLTCIRVVLLGDEETIFNSRCNALPWVRQGERGCLPPYQGFWDQCGLEKLFSECSQSQNFAHLSLFPVAFQFDATLSII